MTSLLHAKRGCWRSSCPCCSRLWPSVQWALTSVVPSLLPIFKVTVTGLGCLLGSASLASTLNLNSGTLSRRSGLGFITDLKLHIHPFDPPFEPEVVVVVVGLERTGRIVSVKSPMVKTTSCFVGLMPLLPAPGVNDPATVKLRRSMSRSLTLNSEKGVVRVAIAMPMGTLPTGISVVTELVAVEIADTVSHRHYNLGAKSRVTRHVPWGLRLHAR